MRNAITNNAVSMSVNTATVIPAAVSDGIESAMEVGGVLVPRTLEVRMTIVKSKSEKVLFAFHGGNVARSGKGDLFSSFWLMPPVYKKREIQFNGEGDLQRSKIWAQFVTKKQEDPAIAQQVAMLKSVGEEQRQAFLQLLTMQNPAQAEQLVKALSAEEAGFHYQAADHVTLLQKVFGHLNVKFKMNLNRFASQLEAIQDRLAEGEADQKFSLVLRFNILSGVNAAKELVELQHYAGGIKENGTEPTLYPNGNPVVVQEITIQPTYVGITEGSTYEPDSTKYVDPDLMASAVLSSMQVKSDNKPTYLAASVLEARASKVNAWSEKIQATTGNKWLKKLGYTSSKGDVPTFFMLALKSHYGDQSAAAEFEAMKVALEGAIGQKDLTADRAKSIIEAAKEFVKTQIESSMNEESRPSEVESAVDESVVVTPAVTQEIESTEDEAEDEGTPLSEGDMASILAGDWASVLG